MPPIWGHGSAGVRNSAEYDMWRYAGSDASSGKHRIPGRIRSSSEIRGIAIVQIIRVQDSYSNDTRLAAHTQVGKDHHRITPRLDGKGRCGAAQIRRGHRPRGRAGQWPLVVVLPIGIADAHGDLIAHIVRAQEVGCRGLAADGRVHAARARIPLIGERQASRAIGIADAAGVRRQGRALGRPAVDAQHAAGTNIAIGHRRRGRAGQWPRFRAVRIGIVHAQGDSLAHFGLAQEVVAVGRAGDFRGGGAVVCEPLIHEYRPRLRVIVNGRGVCRQHLALGRRARDDHWQASRRPHRPDGRAGQAFIFAISSVRTGSVILVADRDRDELADIVRRREVADLGGAGNINAIAMPLIVEVGGSGQTIGIAQGVGVRRQGHAQQRDAGDAHRAGGRGVWPYVDKHRDRVGSAGGVGYRQFKLGNSINTRIIC